VKSCKAVLPTIPVFAVRYAKAPAFVPGVSGLLSSD
jgi:hypothetical protein